MLLYGDIKDMTAMQRDWLIYLSCSVRRMGLVSENGMQKGKIHHFSMKNFKCFYIVDITIMLESVDYTLLCWTFKIDNLIGAWLK